VVKIKNFAHFAKTFATLRENKKYLENGKLG
jgi:hypothetical protein